MKLYILKFKTIKSTDKMIKFINDYLNNNKFVEIDHNEKHISIYTDDDNNIKSISQYLSDVIKGKTTLALNWFKLYSNNDLVGIWYK